MRMCKTKIWRILLGGAILLIARVGAFAAEIPAGAIDFMYINQDKLRFGRPSIEEPLTQNAAEAIIRLHLASCDYAVAITIDANVYDAEKIAAVRSVLTPWLLEIGARQIYFKDLANARVIGNPVIIEVADELPKNLQNAAAPATIAPAPSATSVRAENREPMEIDAAEEIILNQPKIKLRPLNDAPQVISAPAPVNEDAKINASIEPEKSDSGTPLAEELNLLGDNAIADKKPQSPVAAIAIAKPVEQAEAEEIDDPQNQTLAVPAPRLPDSGLPSTLPDLPPAENSATDFDPVKIGE